MKFGLILLLPLLLGSALFTSEAAERKKSLDFEEQTVEGLNKRPLDSLNSLADGLNGNRGRHLYSKKTRFHAENKRTLRDLENLSCGR